MFIESLDPVTCIIINIKFLFQAKVPSRFKVRSLVNKVSAEVKVKIKKALAAARRVSITTDIWSSKGCIDSYMGLTSHIFNPITRKRENYRISFREFNNKHTGKNMAKQMKRIFSEFSIENKVARIISDNASNAIKSVRDLNALGDGEEWEEFEGDDSEDEEDVESDGDDSECDIEPDDKEDDREEEVTNFANALETANAEHEEAFEEEHIYRGPCIVHTMQLPICRVIRKKKISFGRVLTKTRRYVVKYRQSSKAKAILRKTSFKLRLKGWVKTRWWSDVEMVAIVIKASESPGRPLTKLSDQMKWSLEITDNDIAELKDYVSIMEPFMEMDNRLGSEKQSTMHLVFPMITELLQLLENNIKESNHKTFCEVLRNQFKDYFKFLLDPKADKFDPLYITATYLCPVYRFCLDDEMKTIAVDNLKMLIKKADDNNGEIVEEQIEPTEVIEPEVNLSLPGFKMLSAKILKNTENYNVSEQKDEAEQDINKYEKRSELTMEKIKKAAAVSPSKPVHGQTVSDTSKKELKVVDPLDFWVKEVSNN